MVAMRRIKSLQSLDRLILALGNDADEKLFTAAGTTEVAWRRISTHGAYLCEIVDG